MRRNRFPINNVNSSCRPVSAHAKRRSGLRRSFWLVYSDLDVIRTSGDETLNDRGFEAQAASHRAGYESVMRML